ncbi:MAG: site-specific integrase [Chitinophagales bacterium]
MPGTFTIASQSSSETSQLYSLSRMSLPKLVIRKDHVNADSTQAIQLQLVIKSKRHAISTNIRVNRNCWNELSQTVQLPRGRKEEEININLRLNKIRSKAHDAVQYHIDNDIPLTIDSFKREFMRVEMKRDFIQYMQKQIELSPDSRATKSIYRTVCNRLMEFSPVLLFGHFTAEKVREFDAYIKRVYKLDTNTVKKYHTKIKKFLNMAKSDRIRFEDPYENFRIVSKKTFRQWNTAEEMNALIALYGSHNISGHLKETLAAYLFSCLGGGFRISDLRELHENNIINDEIVFQPEKTKRTKGLQRIALTIPAKHLIQGRRGNLFNLRSDKQVEQHMKTISWMAGLKKKITFHIARHTFAMQYLINGGKIEHLQKILGHSKIETTMVYIHMHEDEVNQKMNLMDVFTFPIIENPEVQHPIVSANQSAEGDHELDIH